MSILVSIACIYLAIGLGVGICYHILMNQVADAFDEEIPEFNVNHVKFILHTMVAWPWLIYEMSKEVDCED